MLDPQDQNIGYQTGYSERWWNRHHHRQRDRYRRGITPLVQDPLMTPAQRAADRADEWAELSWLWLDGVTR
jgi:hypothetical protein